MTIEGNAVSENRPARVLAATALVGAVAIAACGGSNESATEIEPRSEAVQSQPVGEDTENPTPAPPPPTLATECPARHGAASPHRAAEALARTPAWATLERERIDDFSAVSARADGVLTGTVTEVAQGAVGPSRSAEIFGFEDRSVRLTVNLLIAVETVDRELSRTVAASDTVAVPLVVFDGSIAGLPEDQVEILHANLTHDLNCEMPRGRVVVAGTVADTSAPGASTATHAVGAVVELPELGWLPDPGAVAFQGRNRVESLDVLVGDRETAGYFGAATVDDVAAAAAK